MPTRPFRGSVGIIVSVLLGLSAGGQGAIAATRERAQKVKTTPPATLPSEQMLQLEVFLNDRPTGLIAAFRQDSDGHISAKQSELIEIGIKAPESAGSEDYVPLDAIESVSYVYVETTQSIRISIGDQQRAAKDYSSEDKTEEIEIKRSWGGALNYNVFTSGIRPLDRSRFSYQGASATLDGRLFSPLGVLSQSGIVGSNIASSRNVLRLDTTWTYSDPRSLMTYRAGDTISSGMAWTRPVRMGGVQVQRNFAIRPDLVTLPLPVISGTAAVPSTLDVYVNNVKAFTQNVNDGPYKVSNLPIVGNGTARVVLHDSTGKQLEETVDFFTTPLLLRPGFTDYSAELGAPRNYYGAESDGYSRSVIGSASVRRGVFNWLTLEGHAEGSPHLANAGLGFVARVFDRGVINVAATGSRSKVGSGALVYGSLETKIGPVTFSLSTQRTFSNYDDLASITASAAPRWIGANVAVSNTSYDPLAFLTSSRPARSIDRVSASLPVPFDISNIGLAFTRLENRDHTRSTIGSVNWSRLGPFGSSLYISAFANVSGKRRAGVFAGLNIPLGPNINASTGVVFNDGKMSASTDIAKSLDTEIGSYGWRVRDTEGRGTTKLRMASAAYRTRWARIEATAQQQGRDGRGSLEIDGSIATLGGGVFLGNRIQDSFAVVDAGAPDVEVTQDNRPVGRTNASGQLLVPNLRAYQRNAISIDAATLPVSADASRTQEVVIPAERTGVLVNFGVKTDVRGAVVVLVDAAGKPLPVGLHGILEGPNEEFMMGYDGRVYITGLSAQNNVRVTLGLTDCQATFAYQPSEEAQATIGPFVCK